MGELWCGTCAPSAGLHKPLTQPSRWTVAYFPGLSVLCGWNQYFVKWRWVNASRCAGLASVHKWQARFFIFPWTVIVTSPLHLQTCGCTSTSEWDYLLYRWRIWKLQVLEQGTFVSRHCTQPCREAHGEHPWSSAIKWLNKNFVSNHQRHFEHICNIFMSKTKKKPWRGKSSVSWVMQSCISTYKVPQQYKRIGVMNRNAQLELFPYFMLIIG